MKANVEMIPRCAGYLPAVFRAQLAADGRDPVSALLAVFEENLLRAEQMARDSHLLFDPRRFDLFLGTADSAFPHQGQWEVELLKWLASGLLLDWDEEWLAETNDPAGPRSAGRTPASGSPRHRRISRLLQEVAHLYRERGTATGLRRAIRLYFERDAEVIEHAWPQGMRIGVSSSVGVDTWLVEAPDDDHQFTVALHPAAGGDPGLTGETSHVPIRLAGCDPVVAQTWLRGPTRLPVSSLLVAADLLDVAGLRRKLLHPTDPLARHLRDGFSRGGRETLQNPGAQDERLTSLLVEELNRVLRGRCLYQQRRFAQVTLATETQALLALDPDGEALVRLNRRLLADAYPAEIARQANEEDTPTGAIDSTAVPTVAVQQAATLAKLRELIRREIPAMTRFHLAVLLPPPAPAAAKRPWMRIGTRPDSDTAGDATVPVEGAATPNSIIGRFCLK